MNDRDAATGSMEPLPASFYARDAVTVARELLGTLLVRTLTDGTLLAGTIVETEAYREDDPASHSHRGPTARAQTMFGPPGRAYVYLIYGMYDCFNVVCEPQGAGAAVLVRAIHPTAGVRAMWQRRFPGKEAPAGLAKWAHGGGGATGGDATPTPAGRPSSAVRNLTSGPGKMCRAMGITRAAHDGAVLTDAPGTDHTGLVVARPAGDGWPLDAGQIRVGPRVGITKAVERPWRFCVVGDAFVSR